MRNRLKDLYHEYMDECAATELDSPEHQAYMANLAVEMAAVEYLMTTDIHNHIGKPGGSTLTPEEAKSWVASMWHITDGARSEGEHWTEAQTTAVGKQAGYPLESITPHAWWAAMNMAWHDGHASAVSEGKVADALWFAHRAHDLLWDDDSTATPDQRLAAYHRHLT